MHILKKQNSETSRGLQFSNIQDDYLSILGVTKKKLAVKQINPLPLKKSEAILHKQIAEN